MAIGWKATDSIEHRFSKFIDKKDDCWHWNGSLSNKGYGFFIFRGKRLSSHRVSYEIHNGKIPEGLFVCHTCDVRKCINPKHLFLGTLQDNRADCVSKSRHGFGEKHGRSKLKSKDIIKIRQLFESGSYSKRSLAAAFNITPATAGKIINRDIWNHI